MTGRRLPGDERGGAAVEFAVTSPFFFLALIGLAQVAIWFWADFSLQRAVDVASRCAAILTTTCGTTGQIQTYAANNAIGLSVPTSDFSVSNATCGSQVSAAYAVPDFTSGFGLPSVTVHVSACYPK